MPVHGLSAALVDRFESRGESEFANTILSAMHKQFGGHAEKTSYSAAMSEWSRSSGGWLPHEEASTKEHFEEVADDIRLERQAERIAKANRTRLWWKFWAKRSR